MFDLTQHLVTITDLPLLPFHFSAIDLANNFHFNVADIHSHINMDLIAQEFKQNVMTDVSKGWDNFVKTGQIWALLIGLIVGYLFKSLTAF